MTMQESTRTRQGTPRSGWSGTVVAIVAVVVVAGIAAVAWLMTSDDGPVAANEAQIEMAFTADGTSYVGDHEIVEGTATITFSNETTGPVTLMAFGYETGSAALAEELEFLEEGENGVPSGVDPAEGFFDPNIGGDYEPGEHTFTAELQPGTYIFDAATGPVMTSGVYRVAVIEVVSD